MLLRRSCKILQFTAVGIVHSVIGVYDKKERIYQGRLRFAA